MHLTADEVDALRAGRPHYGTGQRGGTVCWLRTGEETGGESALLYFEAAPGDGLPTHYHLTYEEHFQVLEGTLRVQVGRTVLDLLPGAEVSAPTNVLHRWRNAGDGPVRFLVEVRPAHPGLEKSLQVLYGLARDGRTTAEGRPRNLYHLALVLQWSETRLPGRFRVLAPALRAVARRARDRGVDRELEERYVR